MNLSFLKPNIQGTRNENSFLRLVVLAMVAINAVMMVSMLSKNVIVTVVPPTMAEQGWIDKNSASEEYTESWALYVASVLGNVNPSTGTMVRTTLEPLLAADIYQDVINALETQIGQIRQDRVVIAFEPKEVFREKTNLNKFFVIGRTTITGPTGRPKRSSTTYEIEMSIRNYKPTITYVTTYTGRPKTDDVVRRDKSLSDAKAKKLKTQDGNQ